MYLSDASGGPRHLESFQMNASTTSQMDTPLQHRNCNLLTGIHCFWEMIDGKSNHFYHRNSSIEFLVFDGIRTASSKGADWRFFCIFCYLFGCFSIFWGRIIKNVTISTFCSCQSVHLHLNLPRIRLPRPRTACADLPIQLSHAPKIGGL